MQWRSTHTSIIKGGDKMIGEKMCVCECVCSFCPFVIRDAVMRLMREVDPEGAQQRRTRRLRRRIYTSKVVQNSHSMQW